MRLVDKEQTMTKQLIGLFDPNGTVFEKTRDTLILWYKVKGKKSSREELIRSAEKWGGSLSEEEIQQLLDMQEQFPEPQPLPNRPY